MRKRKSERRGAKRSGPKGKSTRTRSEAGDAKRQGETAPRSIEAEDELRPGQFSVWRVKRGRPTRLTPDLLREIDTLISAGNYAETAIAYVGVAPKTYHEWIEKGNAALERIDAIDENDTRALEQFDPVDGLYAEFAHVIRRARAKAEVFDVQRLTLPNTKDWRAVAFKLENREREKYARWKHGRKETDPTGAEADTNETAAAELLKALQVIAGGNLGQLAEGEPKPEAGDETKAKKGRA